MLNKYKFKKRYFTLVELLAAMAVFSIISLVMMRFFNSSQKVWSIASQRNILYSDARIALNLMTRDLQCAMYNNENSAIGIYPFWYKYNGAVGTNDYYTTAIADTQLNFITATDIRPDTTASSICEVRYAFVPAGPDKPMGASGKLFAGGSFLRSCTGDKNTDGSTNTKYNFSSIPYSGTSTTRIDDIFKDSSSNDYELVISNVYDFKITCYIVDSSGVLQTVDSLSSAGAWGGTGSYQGFNLKRGTPFPVAIKIDLHMMAKADWNAWTLAVQDGNDYQAGKIIRQKMRTFSKTVFLGARESL
jgi:type II secretory pathway pseudopilin PulG